MATSWSRTPEPRRRQVLAQLRALELALLRHADRCGAGTEAERDQREQAEATRAAIAELGGEARLKPVSSARDDPGDRGVARRQGG